MDDWGGLENRCGLKATVGSNPTLSAGRKKPPGDGSHSLSPTAVSLVIGLTKIKGFTTGVIPTPEIAQLLTFNVQYPHFTYSSVFVKT